MAVGGWHEALGMKHAAALGCAVAFLGLSCIPWRSVFSSRADFLQINDAHLGSALEARGPAAG